jgi:CBS domain-containing protein
MSKVADLLERRKAAVIRVAPSLTVLAASKAMADANIGAVVVTEGDAPIGILSERDILRKIVAQERDPAQTLVRDVMTSPCITCSCEHTLEQVQQMMAHHHIRHLVVMSGTDMVGMVTSRDIMASIALEKDSKIRYLSEAMYGFGPSWG